MNTSAIWHCPKCAEPVPANFDLCWNCGTDRSGVPDESFRPAVGFTPQCEWCGYLLIGLDSPRCPECGQHIDRTKKDTIHDVGGETP